MINGKFKVFRAGRGLYEVRYNEGDKTFGIGTFFSKSEASKISKHQNRQMKGVYDYYNLKTNKKRK